MTENIRTEHRERAAYVCMSGNRVCSKSVITAKASNGNTASPRAPSNWALRAWS